LYVAHLVLRTNAGIFTEAGVFAGKRLNFVCDLSELERILLISFKPVRPEQAQNSIDLNK
jgi:hypothetical protein